jgi:hypothetical protein
MMMENAKGGVWQPTRALQKNRNPFVLKNEAQLPFTGQSSQSYL